MRECVVLEISLFNFGNSGGVSRLEEDGTREDSRGGGVLFISFLKFIFLIIIIKSTK